MTQDEQLGATKLESLGEFLRARARHASDARLMADVVVGALAMAGVLVWRPWSWRPLLSVAVALAAYGVWGIADRELSEAEGTGIAPPAPHRTLRAVRAAASVLGWLGAVSFVLTGLALALGRNKL